MGGEVDASQLAKPPRGDEGDTTGRNREKINKRKKMKERKEVGGSEWEENTPRMSGTK